MKERKMSGSITVGSQVTLLSYPKTSINSLGKVIGVKAEKREGETELFFMVSTLPPHGRGNVCEYISEKFLEPVGIISQ
ncbi:hypothetical protein COV24_00215 [candidate division WWE3 bacterium CG10_big_fil_rev_8_21_14_0_10_32_10]|uniref:Uncharacterized protein n=1 Tax=candidate division WWE3 bacterium CG10_big_fil_rev_8_21_14_0_10_32_10 TaxID=1975090 RepID=A0A2H0RBL7_UNCKA|nr:MAG: hypothetical protein COV24_00215 [candidate division WWE3 bacterium CG10_big_fil_rev_8_21_14_0_10_32_10]